MVLNGGLNSLHFNPQSVCLKLTHFYQVGRGCHQYNGPFHGRRHSVASGSQLDGSPNNKGSPFAFSVTERMEKMGFLSDLSDFEF